ncbi:MAG: lyase family protein, partial [Actinobacteria bacterium]|nr:lyase family protein [Actinomycetota bacterium]
MSHGKLWGGRFNESAADAMEALSRSVHFDWRLAPYDLRGSIAHAHILESAGLLTPAESQSIVEELTLMITQYHEGVLVPESSDEDVHGALERILVERLGEAGGKLRAGRSRNDQVATDFRLRAGRSRNDQVATDFRLFLRDAAAQIVVQLTDLADAFISQAEKHVQVAAPGFTHLQHAQPVSLGHEIAKHAHALLRDIDRLQDWDKRAAYSPLGAGALAGSALELDPKRSALELGFTDAVANSIDAVSDRDFAAEAAFVFA